MVSVSSNELLGIPINSPRLLNAQPHELPWSILTSDLYWPFSIQEMIPLVRVILVHPILGYHHTNISSPLLALLVEIVAGLESQCDDWSVKIAKSASSS